MPGYNIGTFAPCHFQSIPRGARLWLIGTVTMLCLPLPSQSSREFADDSDAGFWTVAIAEIPSNISDLVIPEGMMLPHTLRKTPIFYTSFEIGAFMFVSYHQQTP